jgi:hypothetical protein
MPYHERMELGVIVERREGTSEWESETWAPVAVMAPAPDDAGWRELSARDDGSIQFHAGNEVLELYRADTEAYVENLNAAQPGIYVILSEDEDDGDFPYAIHAVTASPYEAQDVLDAGEDIVECVAMPDIVLAWIKGFVDEHHVVKKFVKRKRDKVNPDEPKFGKEPIFLNPGGRKNRDPLG